MSNKLLTLYKDLLKFAGCETDKENYIYFSVNDKRSPFLVEGVNAVLPTQEHLKSAVGKVIFHPLRENITRGESEVLKKYRNALTMRLNVVGHSVAQYLLNLASSPDLQKHLTSDQIDLITTMGDVDTKAVENFNKVMMHALKEDPHRALVSMYLRAGATVFGKKHARVCIVNFPIYEALVSDEEKVFGVKLRVKDRDIFTRLHKFMFPGIEHQDSYSFGSNSRNAPFMEALLGSGKLIAARLNDLLKTYRDFIDDADALELNCDWVDDLDNLDELSDEIKRIPTQAGNEGSVRVEERLKEQPIEHVVKIEPPTPQVAQPALQPQVMSQQQCTSMHVPAAQPPSSSGHLTVKELLAKNPATAYMPNPLARAAMMQQPMYQQQHQRVPGWAQGGQMMPQQPMYPQQQPMYQQPMYQQPMYPQQQPIYPQQMQQQPMYPQQMQQPMVPQQMPGYRPPWQ